MSDSVGKISLDLEVKSDLGKQISSMSGLIAKNLKTSLNSGTKTMFDGMKKSANDGVKSLDSGVKSTLKIMKNNLKNTMKSVFESMKEVKMPPIKFPNKMDVMKPKTTNIPKANTRRGPPEDIEKLKDMKIGKVQTLDITDRQIDNLRNKLKTLNDQLNNTFNTKGRNKLEGTILSTEARMNSLIEKSIRLGSEITELDSKITGVGTRSNGIGIASQNISKLGRNAVGANGRLSRLSNALTQLGLGAKRTSSHLGGTNSQLKMIIRSMVTWGMIFPLVIRGITAMATSLGQSLMTNQQFANSLAQIKSNLMVAFMPIYQAILPAINALMSALATATTYIASFISAIFGKTYQQSAQATQGLIGAKAAMGAYGNATEKAGKQAKKAQGSLAGFDEINTLNMDNGSDNADGGSGGGGGDIPTLVAPPLDIAPVDSAMAELAQKVKRVFATIFQPFKNAWAKDGASVMAEVKRAVEATKDTFKNFYNVLSTPPVQLFIENIARIGLSLIKLALSIYREFILPIINWFISILPGAANGLNPILDAVRRFIDYLASNGELLRWICSLILGIVVAFKTLVIALQVIKWIEGISTVLEILATNPIILVIAAIAALIAMFVALYASSESFRNKVNEICSAIMEFLAPAFEFLKEKAMDVWNNALVPFGAFLIDLWKTVLAPLAKIIGEILVIAFQAVMDIAKSLWSNVLKPLADFIVSIFIKAIQGIIEIYKAWKPVIQVIIDIILFLWNNVLKPLVKFIVSVFLSIFKDAFKTIGSLIGDLKRIFGGIIDFITGVFTGNWAKAWRGVTDIFGGIMGGLGKILKYPLNAVISLINGAIGGINSLSIDIPDWVPKYGGSHFGLSIPKIPYLAKGGILDSPTLAMVGEAGKEAVVPLENNTGGLDLLASKLLERMPQGNSDNGFGDGDLILQVDGSVIGKVALKQLRKMQRQGNITLIPT
ncbi:hypothetical protein [Clostridium sp. UBA871]|uniref:phage tail protein n=1 Tax=Clostridium sp. UBA871 TaxID=1946380 RepID=UPI00321671A4